MITSSSANEWKLSQLLHELVFVPWIQAVWSCTQLRLIFSWRRKVFWVVFWFFSRRGDADDFGLIEKYFWNCSWVCLMVGKTLDDNLLIDDHQLFGIIQQPYQILNDVATVSSLMQSCKCFIFISVQRSELSQAIATSVDFLQALPVVQNNRDLQVFWRTITVLTIEEIPHYGDQFKYQCQLIFFIEISSLLISNFHAQPWFLTLFKNPGIYFVQIPMPFSSWSSEPVCSPVERNGTGNFSV